MSKPDETMEGDGGPVIAQLGNQDALSELLNDEHHSTPSVVEHQIKVQQISDGLPIISSSEQTSKPIESSVENVKMNNPAPESVLPVPSVSQETSVKLSMPSLNVKSDLLLKEMNDFICGTEPEKKDTEVAQQMEHVDGIDSDDAFDLNAQVNLEDMKAAQEELRGFDVLVCGACHMVFHFVEEFNKHKGVCRKRSNFHGNIAENKPQVWAFLLWKNAQAKINRRGFPVEESSWKLYQKWCKMPERIRSAWVTAGETVMTFSTFCSQKQSENNFNKPALKRDSKDISEIMEVDENRPVVMRKLVQRDHLGEIKEIRPTLSDSAQRRFNENIESIRSQLEDGDNSIDKDPMVTVAQPGEDTVREEEFVVEKIVSRRFNPRRKQYEYLLKWEGYPSEQNTWEPAENLETCQHLLKAFEENLAKQSISKQNKGGAQKRPENNQPGTSGVNSFGRPVRYSKQKALNQVKAWCGSIKPDDSEIENLKRTLAGDDSDDDDDPYAKRIKMERDSDSEDSMQGRVMYTKGGATGIIKRGRGGKASQKSRQLANGTSDNLAAALGLESSGDEGDPAKSKLSPIDYINQKGVVKKVSSLSLANQQVLVANAKGVVKVHPSQVPNLSSGVYIMSNKSGIFKLDSVSPSAAMSIKQGSSPKAQPPAPPPPLKPSNNNASGAGVIMVKNQGQSGQKSGIMRKTPALLRNSNNLSNMGMRGPGRPPNTRPSGVLRAQNPNTRLFHSGSAASRSNIAINSTNRPKTPQKLSDGVRKQGETEKRVLGPKPGRGGRGGIFNRSRGGLLARGAGSVSDTDSIGSKGKDKLQDSDNVMVDFNPDSLSSESDSGIPDDDGFPVGDLPPLEPESPPRPLTLCPETGKVLAKAEGEKTPEPTPPPSPKPPQPPAQVVEEKPTVIPKVEKIKDETPAVTGAYLNKVGSKEALVKKTLKPGSIGSMSVSPKKEVIDEPEEGENNDEIVTITGEDGLIYKVSKSDLDNTVLMAEGADGQQCVYVTTGEDGDENATVLTLDASAFSEQVSQLGQVNILSAEGEEGTQYYVKDGEEGELVGLQVQTGDGSEDTQTQVVAQLVEAGEPQPGGGPRRVVLLLPDGNIMMTEVDEEQYAALELDKFQSSEAEME